MSRSATLGVFPPSAMVAGAPQCLPDATLPVDDLECATPEDRGRVVGKRWPQLHCDRKDEQGKIHDRECDKCLRSLHARPPGMKPGESL
jgi:hypothetical protein